MPLAYSYTRFSTPEQAQGDSKRRQAAKYDELCKRHNLTPAASYFDEGVSAYKGKNRTKGDLAKFLSLVESGKVEQGSWLVVESLDRLSRQGPRQTRKLLEGLLENQIIVATCSPERVLTEKSLDDVFAIIEVALIASRAREESDRKSERVKAAWGNKLVNADKEIVTRRCPAWLTYDETRQGWKELPERVRVIKQIFNWTLKGLGQRAIAKRLNTEGVPPFKTSKRDGKQWGYSYVRLILVDRRVRGEFKSQSGNVPDYFPAISTESTLAWANPGV